MHTHTIDPPRINGVVLCEPGEVIDAVTLRQRACMELLRQQALAQGFTDNNTNTGEAIEQLLAHELPLIVPDEQTCRRHFEAHPQRFGAPTRLRLRHILFAVTPGVELAALRARAEACLVPLRCAEPNDAAFAQAARAWSNCPSGEQGGDLGWVSAAEVAPEFAQQVFAERSAIGVLPRLVHSRHGLHVVDVQERDAPAAPDFASVRNAVAADLAQQAWANAVRRYVGALAVQAQTFGIDLESAGLCSVQ